MNTRGQAHCFSKILSRNYVLKQSTSHIKLGDRTCSTRARKDRITDTPNDMITTKEGDAVGMVTSDQERTGSDGRENAAATRYR
ncbi:hypothetical protein C1T21_03030 [Paenibacillus sp. F4]|nr:hypothetical protein C1T21_03030 [Paenibacillus sp. F4]